MSQPPYRMMDAKTEFKILRRGVEVALNCLYENDADLIRYGVGEQCLVGNFYRYFFEEIQDLLEVDSGLRVDLEYNKCGREGNPKFRRGKRMRWRPDMVVHRRGESIRNVCLFEFKRFDSRKHRKREDRKKLREAVDPFWLDYHFGCYIEFGSTRQYTKVEWRTSIGQYDGRDR